MMIMVMGQCPHCIMSSSQFVHVYGLSSIYMYTFICKSEATAQERHRDQERTAAKTPTDREKRLQRDHERRAEKTVAETPTEREQGLRRDWEREAKRRAAKIAERRKARLHRK